MNDDSQELSIVSKKLKNPYSLKNMRAAYNSLSSDGNARLKDEYNIKATDYYIKFLLKNVKEYDDITGDSIDLYAYPLDYEHSLEAYEYYENLLEKDSCKWFYAVVPVDYDYKKHEYEIIEELFIPANYSKTNARIKIDQVFLDKLEEEALIISVYEKEVYESQNSEKINQARKRYPSGRVQVFDTEHNRLVPLNGALVKTRRWFSTGYGYTDNWGNYRVNEDYKYNVNYSVYFVNTNKFRILLK